MTGVIAKLARLSDFAAGRLLGGLHHSKSGSGEALAVCRKSSRVAISAVALLPFISSISVNTARAAVGEHAGSLFYSLRNSSPVEAIQYYSLNNSNYCWYDAGWQGPGWYSCGYEWDDGLGWGGPYGWNGWGGGHRIRLHGSHGIGVWHHGPATHAFAAGAPASPGLAGGVAPARPRFVGSGVPHFHGFGAPASPGFASSGALGLHAFGGVASASPGFAGGEAPAFHGFGGGAPAFQGLAGGGAAFHGFDAGGGFHAGGGGGAFSFGGHGGGGHR
jgi:hypothetical protein